jgi:hypothetical protein
MPPSVWRIIKIEMTIVKSPMADLVFKKRLKDGRHARLKLWQFFDDDPEYLAIALVAHHHRRTANDWLTKGLGSPRAKKINGTYTGCSPEALNWAIKVIRNNIDKIKQKGYRYLVIGGTDIKRLRIYCLILFCKCKLEEVERIQYEDKYFWVVDLQLLLNQTPTAIK